MSAAEQKESQIIYPFDLSSFKHELVGDEVIRSSMLDTIDMHFEQGRRLIALHGQEGIGKSTLLAQFVERHKQKVNAIFIEVINRQSYSEENIIIDLYRQAYFTLNGDEPENYDRANKRELAKLYYLLDIYLRKNDKKIFLVVDGLSEIPKRDSYVVDSVVDCLPFDKGQINVLLSLDSQESINSFRFKNVKPIEVVVFGEHEASLLLNNVDTTDIKDLLRVFKGVPGNLKIIKRLLEDGMSADDILQGYSASSDSKDLYEAEWVRTSHLQGGCNKLLALVAFSISPLNIDIARASLDVTRQDVVELCGKVGFINIKNETITFSSKGMKLFVRDKLSSLEEASLTKIVDYYHNNPHDETSLSEVNVYNEKLGKYSEIVGQLSNDNIKLLFRKSRSLNEAVKQIKLGRRAANQISSLTDTLRLAHAESILSSLRISDHLESELQCYLVSDDYESAMALVSDAVTVEERLQLLASIASHQKEKSDKVDEGISNRVKEDFEKINPEYLGIDRATDIAAKLFAAFPEMALSLINRIDSLDQSGGNKADYALFRLSMEFVRKNNGSIDLLSEKMETIEDKKKEALSMLGLFKKGTPANKIISKVDSFSEPGDAIFVLRHWIKSYPQDEGTFKLASKLMSLIISTTDYHANASVYADICTALPFMNKENGIELINRVTPELGNLKRIGPSIDYVRLQCHLVLFEERYSVKSARASEVAECLKCDINDLSTKLSALNLVHQLAKNSSRLASVCDFDSDKKAVFEDLIENSADHVSLIRDALIREVTLSVDNALFWASELNTRPRRDFARSLVIREACKQEKIELIDQLCLEVRRIKNKDFQNEAAEELFRSCAQLDSISKADLKRLTKLRNKIKDSFVRCNLNISLLKCINKITLSCEEQRENVIEDLKTSFNNIEGDWYKIDVAYKIHSSLSNTDSEIAERYKKLAITLRKDNFSHNEGVVNSQIYSVDLIIRSFYFLCKQDLEDDDGFSQVLSCIKGIPSRLLRIKQAARLCSALRINNKTKYEKELIEELLLPEYEDVGLEFSREFAVASFWALPILFKYNRSIFERKMEVLQEDEFIYDEVLWFTQSFIVNEVLLGDPFDPVKNHKFNLGASDLEDYVYLVKHIKEESRLYFAARKLVNVITRFGKAHYSRVQINLVVSLLEELVDAKFDSIDHISHCGYKICCAALKLKVLGVKNSNNWQQLVDWIEEVPVKSDRVFILGQIVESMPAALLSFKKQLLAQAVDITDSLDCGYERISRFEYLAEVGIDVDKVFVKDFVKRAVLLSTHEDSDAFEEKRLSLIDSLYSMDKEFASSLSAMVDDDPARKRIIEENVERKKQERIEREKFDLSSDDIVHENITPKYPNMIWKLLGKLNANNHVPQKKGGYQKFLDSVSQYPFEQAYPMLSYFIHTVGFASQNKMLTQANIRPLFDVLVRGTNLFNQLCVIDKEMVVVSPKIDGSIVFGEGDLQAVENFVRDWIVDGSQERGLITIIDPYFGLSDFEFVGNVINKDPDYHIRILTSFSNLSGFSDGDSSDPDDSIRAFWCDNVTSDSMPDIDVIFCGIPSLKNQLPVHDRWWLMDNRGLRFGGSINGIGGKRVSSICDMNNQEVVSVEHRVAGFLDSSQRSLDGERVKYQIISA